MICSNCGSRSHDKQNTTKPIQVNGKQYIEHTTIYRCTKCGKVRRSKTLVEKK